MTTQLADPVCGMTVTPGSEHHYAYKNSDYYFCCRACQGKFAANPEHYLKPPPASTANDDLLNICPLCPEVRQQGPCACPSCGMALEPETLQAPPTRTEYTCPMHPEIVQDAPGNCPKCGMALEPRSIVVEEKKCRVDRYESALLGLDPAGLTGICARHADRHGARPVSRQSLHANGAMD